MRKKKINYYQLMQVLEMHLESIGAITKDEHIEITPLVKTGEMITVYIYKNRDV